MKPVNWWLYPRYTKKGNKMNRDRYGYQATLWEDDTSPNLTAIIAIAVIAAALMLAGAIDYRESKRQESEYCRNVAAKVWPDYNNNFSAICQKEVAKRNRTV